MRSQVSNSGSQIKSGVVVVTIYIMDKKHSNSGNVKLALTNHILEMVFCIYQPYSGNV